MDSEKSTKWLGLYSKIVAISVFLLILKGSLVTSHDAGLSVPDWPNSYGENMFLFPPSKWVGIIFYEHVHRLLASAVGLLVVILTAWTAIVEKRKWVRVLTYFALGAVIIQGILGGLTVLLLLPLLVSASHAVLAQTFFIITVIIAYAHSNEFKKVSHEIATIKYNNDLFRLSIISVIVIYLQLIFGALMRHAEAGLAIPDFPKMGGVWLPKSLDIWLGSVNQLRAQLGLINVDLFQVSLHLLHRFWAFVVLGVVLFMAVKVIRSNNINARILARVIFVLVIAQFLLGILTVLSLRSPWIASIHVFMGAATLASSVLISLRIRLQK